MSKSGATYITDNIMTDKAEQIHYQDPHIPYYILRSLGKVSHTNGVLHWHNDIEISVCVQGVMRLTCNGREYEIKEGEGFFTNAHIIHGGFFTGADQLCVRLNPILLCTNEYMEQNFVQPVLRDPGMTGFVLSPRVDWQKTIIDLTEELYMFDSIQAEGMPLLIQRYFFHIWYLLYSHSAKPSVKTIPKAPHMSTLKDMIGFIQENYAEKIKLKDIAAAGNVSQSTCNAIFTSLIHQSPVAYLLSYRLNEAQALLRKTNDSVTEIASATGFNGISYFTESFRREFGMTPRQYRKSARNGTLRD